MNKKFTLLELLIVIAIIGILITMLLPSLDKARRATRAAVCASNEKQIGIASAMYLRDNNATFTGEYWTSGAYNAGEYVGRKKLGSTSWATPCYKPIYHFNYMPNWDVFMCPETQRISKAPMWVQFRNSYPGNRQLQYNVKLAQIDSPSEVAFTMDGWSDAVFLDWRAQFISPRHDGKANVLFIDNSVKRMTSASIILKPQMLGYNRNDLGNWPNGGWRIENFTYGN